MGAVKVLVGLVFVILGVVLLVLVFAPIPGFEDISIYDRIMRFIDPLNPNYVDFGAVMMTFDFTPIFQATGMLSINTIIVYVAYHYIRAGIKSMRYDKQKKQYYYTETKIALFIVGFVMICIAVVLVLTILLQILAPAFQFITDLVPSISLYGIIQSSLIPIVLTLMIIFFIYWLGSIIMKKSVKKEEMLF